MKLQSYLREHNLSDHDFAVKIGSSSGAVKKWRYGERVPRSEMMNRIAIVTNGAVTANDFMSPSEAAA